MTPQRVRLYPGLRHVVLLASILNFIAVIVFPADSSGFWPFTSKKESYIARVGNEVITTDEFIEAINKLHMSDRVGKALSEEQSFARQDFSKFLDELIDERLMMIEAINLGLDKEAEVIMSLDNHILNLSLEMLRQEDIFNKVKVEDREIEAYYQEQLRGKEEKEKDKEEIKHAHGKNGEDQGEMSRGNREAIKKRLFNEKVAVREKEYFAQLRRKSSVKVDNEVLQELSSDNAEAPGKTIAVVNGEHIFAIDVLRNLGAAKLEDEAAIKEILDRLILHKILDQEALNRKYTDDKAVKTGIKKFKRQLLVEQFKKKAVLPAIKVEEKEIMEYYSENREKYLESDRINFRLIHVIDEKEARMIMDELTKGADFSYLAREKSIDPSKDKGGDVGWVNVNHLSDDIKKAVTDAKQGDILGPFPLYSGYAVLEFRAIEKGGYIPLEKVRNEIDRTIGAERFETALNNYIKRLKETMPVEINQQELKRVQGR